MTVHDCPGCNHPRDAHKGGACFAAISLVTTHGDMHYSICGSCPWEPFTLHNGSKGWRHHEVPPEKVDFDVNAHIEAVERLLGFR